MEMVYGVHSKLQLIQKDGGQLIDIRAIHKDNILDCETLRLHNDLNVYTLGDLCYSREQIDNDKDFIKLEVVDNVIKVI